MFNAPTRKGFSITPRVMSNLYAEKMAAPNNAYYVLTQAHAGLPNSILTTALPTSLTADNNKFDLDYTTGYGTFERVNTKEIYAPDGYDLILNASEEAMQIRCMSALCPYLTGEQDLGNPSYKWRDVKASGTVDCSKISCTDHTSCNGSDMNVYAAAGQDLFLAQGMIYVGSKTIVGDSGFKFMLTAGEPPTYKTFHYDVMDQRFEFDDDVYILGDLILTDDFYASAKGMTVPLPGVGVTAYVFNMVGQLTTGLAFHRTAGAKGNIEFIGAGTPNHIFKTMGAGAGDYQAIGSISSGVKTITSSSDDFVVSGVNTLFVNTSEGDIIIGGLKGGVAGQVLYVAMKDTTNSCTLEHVEGVGTQDMYLCDDLDETLDDHGGWVLICDGSNWYDCSHAKHV